MAQIQDMPHLVRNGLREHGVATHATSPHRISNPIQRIEVSNAASVAAQDTRGGFCKDHADFFGQRGTVDGRVGSDLFVVEYGGEKQRRSKFGERYAKKGEQSHRITANNQVV